MKEYKVRLLWDNEASVWVATSTDIEGLVLESGSLDALVERVKFVIPELLSFNHPNDNKIRIHFISERYEETVC